MTQLYFSGLMNNTVIDWFLPWPQQALLAVAQSFLGLYLHSDLSSFFNFLFFSFFLTRLEIDFQKCSVTSIFVC